MVTKRLMLGLGFVLILAIFTSIKVYGFSLPPASINGLLVGDFIYLPFIDKPQVVTPTPTPTSTLAPTPLPSLTPTPTKGPAIFDVSVGASPDTFSPSQITIHVGDTVRWTWASNFHTVTSGSTPGTADGKFCSPNNTDCGTINTSNTGAVFEQTFTQAGTFAYFCQIHFSMGMTGSVIVKP